MTSVEFEQRYRELLTRVGGGSGNLACMECPKCEGCVECQFCTASRDLVRCRYTDDSTACSDSSHLRDCVRCTGCTHCVSCERCYRSAYLERCVDCRDCTYCFGCVGLTGRDFYILNEPYDRKTYFEMLEGLRRGRR